MKEFAEKLIGRLEELKTFKLNLADAMSELMKKDRLDNYISREETIEIVNRLAEEYNNGWIPCSELPEEEGLYLCTVLHADDYFIWIMRFYNGAFLKPDDVEDWHYILLAWQPLPAPYKKGE